MAWHRLAPPQAEASPLAEVSPLAEARAQRDCPGARACALAFALCLVLAFSLFLAAPSPAWADELSDIRAELEAKTSELNQLLADAEEAQETLGELDASMESILAQIDERQQERAGLQERMRDLSVTVYKERDYYNMLEILSSAQTIPEMLNRVHLGNRVLTEYALMAAEQERLQEELESDYAAASAERDKKDALLASLEETQGSLQATIDDLSLREAQLNAEQQVALAQAAAASRTVAKTFASGDTSGWRTGLASAYGGSSDASTPNPGVTATGAICDDWSVGVAVPMAWGPGAYYGRKVEISYGGRSIVATVNDCGGMGGGSRALDLQPGIFKALGASTCNEWGVREVRYRFL